MEQIIFIKIIQASCLVLLVHFMTHLEVLFEFNLVALLWNAAFFYYIRGCAGVYQ